jgi:competence protein ComEA
MRLISLVALALILPTVVFAASININTANATLLDTLPGIGPSKAAAIIDYRTKHGLFATIENIQDVSGIGPATFAKLKSLITVGTTISSTTPVQPSPTPASYNGVQTVEPVIHTKTNIQPHEEAVTAPAAANDLAAAGAPLPPAEDAASSTPSHASGILQSPWLFGLIGVVVVAGGAFVLL